MAEAVHTAERLAELQALPLSRKIQISQARIIEWYQKHNGNVIVSFSGGKDSTVLLHLVRTLYPDVPAVFSNTGLEYPEIQRFARKFPNVTVVTPKMRFDQVISTYGYPLIGKEVAEAIYYARKLRSQTVQVERESKGEPSCIIDESFSASELAGGTTLIQTSNAANRRTILQGKWGERNNLPAGDDSWKPNEGAGTLRDNGRQRDFKRMELGGAEPKPVDGRLSEPRNVETLGPLRETTSRGEWHDYHRRSLNNDPNNPANQECFFNRDRRKTDWRDWRRRCL